MKIFVCTKQVPDTAQAVKIAPDGLSLATDGMEFVINPYDEYAIEEALLIKEKKAGAGMVTLVSVGPERVQKALRSGLAMGADEAVQLWDPAFEGSDQPTVARILAAFFKKTPFDIIFTGKQAVDDDTAVVTQALAEHLGLPHVTEVKFFELAADKKSATVHREIEGGTEVLTCTLPAVFSAQKGLNIPRYASLKGIMAAKKKTLRTLAAGDLGLDPATVGAKASKVKVRKIAEPEAKKGGLRMIPGDVTAQVVEAARILREELKVI